ncbi:MAG: NnrS family protein [Bdellovibrio sp.]|nr:NnrS family protein [Bdellovibrio sp.]
MATTTTQMDAYRYFFPAGWLLGLWGVLLWILFPWNLVSYPGLHHPEIMMGGFFLCFVCGFLMTAAPRFTETFGPTVAEQKMAFALLAGLFLSLLPQQKSYFYAMVIALFVFLIFYLMRRFLRRQKNPPDSFLFVGFGVGAGIIGSVILFLAEFFNIPNQIYDLGRLFFLQAYVLCLVLGVGSRLIPALLGSAPLPTEAMKMQPQMKLFTTLAFLFLLSYILEVTPYKVAAHFLRAVLISFIAYKFWKLHLWPKRKAFQSYWLWGSGWFLLLGQWALVFFPSQRIHILHVILVSGLGLMTVMIATRVTLSHGKHDMQIENKSKILFIGAGLLALAGLTRLSAGFAPHIYQSHLLYAACTWILGLLVWGFLLIPKMICTKGPPSH